LTVYTGAPHIKAAANIAEFGSASATHVVAPSSLFDPHSAVWALFELRASHKLIKCLIKKVRITVSFEFFTRLPLVSIRFAIQAKLFFAFNALEIIAASSAIEYECIVTVWSRTPRNISLLRESLLKRVISETFVIFS